MTKTCKVLPKLESTRSLVMIPPEIPKGKFSERLMYKSSILGDDGKVGYNFSKEVLSPRLTNMKIPPTESVSRFGHKSFRSISTLRLD